MPYRLQAHLGLEGCTVSLPLRLSLQGADPLAVDQNPKTTIQPAVRNPGSASAGRFRWMVSLREVGTYR